MKWFSKNKKDNQIPSPADMTPLQAVTHLCACIQLSDGDANFEEKKAWLNGGLSFRACFSDITKKLNANKIASNYIKQKIINIVQDKEIAKKLTDFGHPFTSKRPTLNTDYFETFNKKNVRLIDLKENPIVKITKNGIKTKNEDLKFDKIIFATGYDEIGRASCRERV